VGGEGGGEGVSFPKPECIAHHGMWRVFDDWLEKFARQPTIPFKRLVLLYCDVPLRASALMDAFEASRSDDYVQDGAGACCTTEVSRAIFQFYISHDTDNFRLRGREQVAD